MSYYEEIVPAFVAASRSVFVSPQYCVELDNGALFWIDFVAIDHKTQRIYLCEVTYDKNLTAFYKGKKGAPGKVEILNKHSAQIKSWIMNKIGLTGEWDIWIWMFVLRECAKKAVELQAKSPSLPLKITFLECTAPWAYSSGFWKTEVEPGKPYPVDEVPIKLQ